MRILDPVHKHITFSDAESRVLDSLIFQRLRYIRQLGFSEFAFPGAVHNRFLHSLGVSHLAGRAFDSLFSDGKILNSQKRKQFRQLLRIAALLHDVGHGPLSHISEAAMPLLSALPIQAFKKESVASEKKATHEHYTIKFILESDLADMIRSMDVDPLCVASLIDDRVSLPDKNFFISDGLDFRPLLKQIISSDLDVDRMDYLRRDSYFCGTNYGLCDHEWILNNLELYIQKEKVFLAIGPRALYSVENFLLGRRHMGLVVYFHNKMVAMDAMLCRYFSSPDCDFHIPISLDEYIFCTDDTLFENLRGASKSNEWARRIIEKKPYERVYEIQYPYLKQQEPSKTLEKIKIFLEKNKIHFIHTNSMAHIRRLYLVPEAEENYPIYIFLDEEKKSAVKLREKMKAFNQLDHVQLVDRIYVSPENRPVVERSIQSLL